MKTWCGINSGQTIDNTKVVGFDLDSNENLQFNRGRPPACATITEIPYGTADCCDGN